jgi:hypothetical protein
MAMAHAGLRRVHLTAFSQVEAGRAAMGSCRCAGQFREQDRRFSI